MALTSVARWLPPRRHITLLLLCIGVASYSLLQSLIAPVLPDLQLAFHTSQADVTWLISANLLSAAVCTPILGRMGDTYGKRRMFLLALFALGLGSLLAALAPTLGLLIVARVLQGLGSGVIPLAFGIAHDVLPAEEVAGGIGAVSGVAGVGAGLGFVVAGPIADALGYRWIFWIPLLIVTVVGLAGAVLIEDSPVRTKRPVDMLPLMLFSGWLILLLLVVTYAASWGVSSIRTWGLLIVALIAASMWVRLESRSANPLIDMKLMRRRAVWANNGSALLLGIGMYAFPAFVPQFLQTPRSIGYGFGTSITRSGLIVAPYTIGVLVTGLFIGWLTRQIGSRRILICGGTVVALSVAELVVLHSAIWEVLVSTSIFGLGVGLLLSAQANLIVTAVPVDQTGVAAGMNANIRLVGSSIGTAAMATIVASRGLHEGYPRESGYLTGFAVLAIATGLGAAVATLIPVVKQRTHPRFDADLAAEAAAAAAPGIVAGVDM